MVIIHNGDDYRQPERFSRYISTVIGGLFQPYISVGIIVGPEYMTNGDFWQNSVSF